MPHGCQHCDFQAPDEQTLQQHETMDHPIYKKPVKMDTNDNNLYPYKCVVCNYATNSKHHIRQHQRIHCEIKPYQCKHCQYKTGRKYNLESHTKLVHNNFRLLCSQCNFTTTRKAYLNMHTKFVHK